MTVVAVVVAVAVAVAVADGRSPYLWVAARRMSKGERADKRSGASGQKYGGAGTKPAPPPAESLFGLEVVAQAKECHATDLGHTHEAAVRVVE
jgi:hypothetical protein